MLDLSNPEHRSQLEKLIISDIDEWCVTAYTEGHRNHLGASVMGKPCSRMLWYIFRWVKAETFDGRMLRLFQVGHKAEPRMIDYLRGIGFEVIEKDPETGKQFKVSGVGGHYGGGLDGMCKAPAKYNIVGNLIFLNEFKTNKTGAGFTDVEKDIKKAKPEHWAQMCQYGFKKQIKYAIYLIENKNDSSLIIKILELDLRYGEELERKASDIIRSKFPPPRISDNPTYNVCQNLCSYRDICHYGEPVEKNCRSCAQAEPTDNAKWACTRWQAIIPDDVIKIGCEYHSSVNEVGNAP